MRPRPPVPEAPHERAAAVEVFSPSTRAVDLLLKKGLFAESGVGAYWVVDPLEPSIRAWTLVDGDYVEAGHAVGHQPLTLSEPFSVTTIPHNLLDGCARPRA